MKRTTWLGVGTSVVTLAAILLASELFLRVYHGKSFSFDSLLVAQRPRTARAHAEFDSQLGWTPAEGEFGTSPSDRWRIEASGLRSNGTDSTRANLSGRGILALGDSFTFGDEVRDYETWPARLEALTQVPVWNAGVFAYGVDQAYLRGLDALESVEPDFVLLAMISDDINRTEFSYYHGWKPYFEWVDATLVERNIPVPRRPAPAPPFESLRTGLGYSFLARTVFKRLAPAWWTYGSIERAHEDGERVTLELLRRLDQRARDEGARFVAIMLGTNGRIGNDARLPALVELARQHELDVLDLAPEVAQLLASDPDDLFLEGGHYSASMNGWVAQRVADHIAVPRSSEAR